MAGEYDFYIKQFDRTGSPKRTITDYLWLQYRNDTRSPGRLDFGLPDSHVALEDTAVFDQFWVYWRNRELGVDWHVDFRSVFRQDENRVDMSGLEEGVFKCPGHKSLLGYRRVAYKTGVTDRAKFTAVATETIMKTLVEYNTTALAVSIPGDNTSRIRSGDLASGMGLAITIETDQGRGSLESTSLQMGNLLDILYRLSEQTGHDFDLVWTGSNTWEFRFYLEQLGEDKTSGSNAVQFSLQRGNLLTPVVVNKRLLEETVVIVGGQGRGLERAFLTVEGEDYSANNDMEGFLAATNEPTPAGLTTTGQTRAEERRAVLTFTFDTLQTSTSFYHRNNITGKKTYREGDLVSVLHQGLLLSRKITAVDVSHGSDTGPGTVIQIETEKI